MEFFERDYYELITSEMMNGMATEKLTAMNCVH